MIDRIVAWVSAFVVGALALAGIYLSGKKSARAQERVRQADARAESETAARQKVEEASDHRQKVEAEVAKKSDAQLREDLIRDWSQKDSD